MSTLATILLALLLGLLLALANAAYTLLVREQPPEQRLVSGNGALLITPTTSPNHTGPRDITRLVLLITLKHVLPRQLRYVAPLLPGPAGTGTFTLPSVNIMGKLSLNATDLASFTAAVLQQNSPTSATTTTATVNPFFLPSLTVPLTIHLLAHRAVPIAPFGAVNTRNTLLFLSPSACRDFLSLQAAATAGELTYTASFGGPGCAGLRRKRGVEFCITITVLVSGREICVQECWFLAFLPKTTEPRFRETGEEGKKKSSNPSSSSAGAAATAASSSTTLALTPADPLRWAAASKDYNPIHVSPLGARLFGFKSVIAHGNHVAALAVQGLLSDVKTSAHHHHHHHAEAERILWRGEKPFVLEVKFVRPTGLPTQAEVRWDSAADGRPGEVRLEVAARGKVCVEGMLWEE